MVDKTNKRLNKILFFCLTCSLLALPRLGAAPVFDAAFGFEYQSCSPQAVTIAFQDQSNSEGITDWAWVFSDGQTSNLRNPVITITSSQMLGVRLTISTAGGGSETTTQTLDVRLMDDVLLPDNLLLCPGGAIPLNSRGNQAYTYRWSPATGLSDPNSANPLASPAESLVYTVTITDDSGAGVCEQIKQISVTVPEEIPFTLLEDYTTCESEVTLTVTTDPIYDVNWFDIDANKIGTGETVTVMPNGRSIYFVEIIDEFGCSVKDDIVVTQVDPPVVTAVPENPSCPGLSSGIATATAVEGTPPYAFNWSNGGTTATITGLPGGSYTVTVTDVNGCTDEATVTIIETTPITANVFLPAPICNGTSDAIILATASGGTVPYSFDWSTGQSGQVLSGVPAGMYTVTATDANGCTGEASAMVKETDPIEVPTASTDESAVDANDGTATVNPDGGTEPYSFEWSNGDTTQSVTGLAPGSYTVTVTDAMDCTAEATVLINEAPDISITGKPNDPPCNGQCSGTIETMVSGGVGEISYSWSDGITTAQRTGLCAGDYGLTITDENGNTQTAGFTIANPPLLNATVQGATAPTCNGESTGSASISASGGTGALSYSWSNGNTSETLSEVPAGEYEVTVTDANGCSTVASVIVPEPAPLTASISSEYDPCSTEETLVSLQGSSNVENIMEWNWILSDGTVLSGPNPEFTTTGPIELTVNLSITTDEGCTAEAPPSLITIAPFQPSELQESVLACPGASAELNPGGGNDDFSYSWSPAEGLNNSNSANPVATLNETTNFVVTISNGACEVTDTVQLMVPPPIDLMAEGDTSLCEISEVGLSASGDNILTLEWSDNPAYSNILGTEADLNVSPEQTTTYYVRATDEVGCITEETVTIVNNRIQVAFNQSASACGGENTRLEDQILNLAADQTLVYDWMPDDVIIDGGDTGSPTINASESTVLNVNVTNDAGCEFNGDVSIEIVDIESALAVADPPEIIQGSETTLSVTGPAEATYSWSPSEGLSDPSSPNPTVKPTQTTSYTVTIETAEGCATTRTVTVTVSPAACEEPFVFFPNAFTPNNDGENDVLFLRGNNITDMYFAIYSRWGELVFESRNLNSGWDGRFNGEPVNPDVYGFYLEATCLNGDTYFKKGNVTVLK